MSKDAVGLKFHDLEIIEYLGYTRRGHEKVMRCRCSCGKTSDVYFGDLKADKIKSCGCKWVRSGRRHHHWKGCGEITGRYWYQLKEGAKKRGIEFALSIERAWEIYQSQDGKCALTGIPLVMCFTQTRFSDNTASLDRKDSGGGYLDGNVQWVHKHINRMKQMFDEDYFISLCRAVAEKNPMGEVKKQ